MARGLGIKFSEAYTKLLAGSFQRDISLHGGKVVWESVSSCLMG